MCVDEFIAYFCGHRSLVVLRACPSTTAQPNLPVCSLRPARPEYAETMCSPCERLLHTRWVLIREWEHRWYHERGACGCPVIFPNLVTRPRVIGGPDAIAPAPLAAPAMSGVATGFGSGFLGIPPPSLPPRPWWVSGPQATGSAAPLAPVPGATSVSVPAPASAGSTASSGAKTSAVGSAAASTRAGPPPNAPTGPAIPTGPAALRRGGSRGRGGRNNNNNTSRGGRPTATTSGASAPVPTTTITPPAGPSGPSTSVGPLPRPTTSTSIRGVASVPPIISEFTVGDRQAIAVRLPGLYAAEWMTDHREFHAVFPAHCPVETRPVRHISDEDEFTNEERALLEDCRLLAGIDPTFDGFANIIASTAAQVSGIFHGDNADTLAARALHRGQAPLRRGDMDFGGIEAITQELPLETYETTRSDLPVLGLPIGAGPEGTSHMQPFGACRLIRPEVKRRRSCEF
ncbi:hypothetical protein V8F20_003074 [Naviculisporaceae sp. PSN 640]